MKKFLPQIQYGFTQMKYSFVACCLVVFATNAMAGTKTSIQLNWKPEPEFGGFYAAKDAFSKHELDVDIVAGGSGTPTVQMIGAGRVDFGIVSADELIVARSRGNKVIALFAVYQTNPQGIMTRASRKFSKIDDVFTHSGTLAIQKGLPYASFLEKKFGFGKLQIVPAPFGDLSKYRSDENYAMQCFVTSEPLDAKKIGVEPTTFLISDAGWNPYTTVLATTDDYLKDHRDVCDAMITAVREGWDAYLNDPSAANAVMNKLNPTMTPDTFAASAAAQVALIKTPETELHGLGSMTRERWSTLIDQMRDLNLIAAGTQPEAINCMLPPTEKK